MGNSKELVAAALRGETTHRVPTGPLAVHFCARIAGHSLHRYSTDAAALAESVLRYHERFRPDAIWVSADTWVSAEAMGARVGATNSDQPLGGMGEPAVRTVADLDRIPAPDVERQGRYPLMLEALSRVVAAVGRDVFIVACFDQYPFSLAAGLMGLNEIMVRLHDDPPFVQGLMGRAEEYVVAYGRALAAAGADLLSGGDSPAGLVHSRAFEAVALPAERRVIAALKSATRKPVSLHICGDATRLLPALATSGAAVLELDHAVDLPAASQVVGADMGLWGNLDPVGLLAQGTPAEVRQATQGLVAAMRAAGHRRFVLSSGCTLAVETPAANLEALIQAATQ